MEQNRKTIILVGKDGRPSMRGTFSKMVSNVELFVRRRITKKSGAIIEWFRKYIGANSETFTKVAITAANFTNTILIRWGNAIKVDTTNCIVYNKAENIQKATDKKLTRQILAEANVRVPRAVNPQSEDIKWPVIARPKNHAKGKNFIILNNIRDFQRHYIDNERNGWYYSEFVDKVSEFRIHCAHGRILNYLEKPNPGNGQIAWNRALNGEAFTNIKWDNYDSKVAKEALKAIQALGLDFGGVDVIVDAEGNPYVLEINTSPTLSSSEYSMSRYALYFDWLGKSNERRKHHEFKEFKKASNYAWHTYHFEDREPNN